MIQTAFINEDLYWKNKVRGSRFNSTLKAGLLYRPQIVDDLLLQVRTVLEEPTAAGIMVKGPGGIGKSHSLVNLVRKLVYNSNNKYLVTFIPDCEQWQSSQDLLTQICASFGSTLEAIGIPPLTLTVADYPLTFVVAFIKAIDDALRALGKQWVFVFDQINTLFVKPMNLQAKDASGLAFPYNFIKLVMEPGRITSIFPRRRTMNWPTRNDTNPSMPTCTEPT
jgi:Cdc6-like AAA superfamily ATPase